MRSHRYLCALFILGTFLLVGCSTNDEITSFVPSENLEDIVIPQVEVPAQELPGPFSGTLSIYGDSPIFQEGTQDSWDASLVLPGAVLYHGGLYHMFYNGVTIDRGLAGGGIGYAVSANGLDWYRMAETPLLNWDDAISEDTWVRASSALIEDDGTWVLYFSSFSRGIVEELPKIWRATAPASNGPWTFDNIPILEPGGVSTWDYYGVMSPVVLKTNGGYLMYYLNVFSDTSRSITGIGLATSNDGINWTKYNDPTTDELFSESDPIFVYESEISRYLFIQTYFVWQDSNGFSMFYGTGRNDTTDMYYMTSQDGVAWTASVDEPVFSVEEVNFLADYGDLKVLYNSGQYFVYMYGSPDSQSFGDIYLAIAE